ncbi:uncharacterized protein DNG_06087 [Cephalotrichum gorgonifer]|uniref:Protein prenyltransferase n=1 Tax=Cephalotrichum gorgonifer TaxID=2041049 RepID=A0AAE8SWA4_9PEZI|nr:uncharacterized protein DNG_06087 [Cephalotrichum gorgonifer]
MSRALDKGVLEALRRDNPELAYNDISRLFDSPRDDGLLLEIEFLGEGYPVAPGATFLVEGNAVGIPKIRLFQAFSLAYRRFKGDDPQASRPQEDKQSLVEVLRPTAVLLLVDPEHLTAANSRKREILGEISQGGNVNACLQREKWALDSLLTSWLHRHTKSPVLWNHRRWLLSQFQKYGLPVDVPGEIRAVVLISGVRHPKNYYAWDHARWLVRTFLGSKPDQEVAVLLRVIADVKGWCLAHRDDISGWTFLHFLLRRGGAELEGERAGVFRSVLQGAESPEDLLMLEEIGGRMFDGVRSGGSDTSNAELAMRRFRILREAQAS